MVSEPQAALWISIAALGGAAVGVERQWSGKASGPHTRFAGIRTFTLLGAVGGAAGAMWASAAVALAVLLLAGGVGLTLAAYIAASRTDVDGTTEVAALTVLAAGALSGFGYWHLGLGIAVATAFLLAEKSALHRWVEGIGAPELRAGFRFGVMAVIVLQILPEGPYGPLGGIRPREIWILVLFFSGLSFVGYIARSMAGPKGYFWAGLLGGLISSTNVTLNFSRTSRKEAGAHSSLALGVIAACTVLYFRVLAACAVLFPPMVAAVWRYLIPPAIVGIAMVALAVRRRTTEPQNTGTGPENPLQFAAALQMGVLFQVVLMGVHAIRDWFGSLGLLASAAVLGLTDIDALTVAMAKAAESGDMMETAAKAICIGIVANTVLKLSVALFVGQGRFRVWCAAGLITLGLASTSTLVI